MEALHPRCIPGVVFWDVFWFDIGCKCLILLATPAVVPELGTIKGLHLQTPATALIEHQRLSRQVTNRRCIFVNRSKVGVLRDRDGQVDALTLGRQFKPLGNFTTSGAAVRAIFDATIPKKNPGSRYSGSGATEGLWTYEPYPDAARRSSGSAT